MSASNRDHYYYLGRTAFLCGAPMTALPTTSLEFNQHWIKGWEAAKADADRDDVEASEVEVICYPHPNHRLGMVYESWRVDSTGQVTIREGYVTLDDNKRQVIVSNTIDDVTYGHMHYDMFTGLSRDEAKSLARIVINQMDVGR